MPTVEEKYLTVKRALFDKAYGDLNERQREAVFTVNHPLLVLAGAGSGKTTVLVRRIAFQIRFGNAYYSDYVPYGTDDATVEELEAALSLSPAEITEHVLPRFSNHAAEPYRVLAITFTNKAANEIKERLARMFPDDPATAADICTGTFHSLCVRILHRYGELAGYRPGFTIYDTDDSKKAMLEAMKRCGIDEKLLAVKTALNAVSRAKDRLLSPDGFAAEAGQDFRQKQIARVYEAYQQLLRESNALDFDDLIMQTVLLLKNHADVREYYQQRFRYVSVDEFQDTNVAQLQLTVLLSDFHKNLMVVGDDDQSIYKFRGATIENILKFDSTYPEAKIIKLEQNYRSTQNILDAANAVISHNLGRKGKTLWTAQEGGAPIRVELCDDQNAESRAIVDIVTREVAAKRASYRDFAILYRTNAQSQTIEKVFARSAVPYRVLGGTRFSDREEIRDVTAYLQLIQNPSDNLRLRRIINKPSRKIGAKTLEAISAIAEETDRSEFDVILHANDYTALERSREALAQFAGVVTGLRESAKEVTLDVLFDLVLDRTGYRRMWEEKGEEEAERLDNLDEFKSGILEYVEEAESPSLEDFLEVTALVADVDRYDETADAVVMMTVHSAKGLEFPVVFLPGMEEGLFPGSQTVEAGDAEMEEERRLAYVAITRAKKELYILHTRTRMLYGRTMYNMVSRFVSEIPSALVEKHGDGNDSARVISGFSAHGTYGGFSGSPASGVRKRVYIESASGAGASAPASSAYRSGSERGAGTGLSVGKPIFGKPNAAGRVVLEPGDRVRHGSFGDGTVLSVKQMGVDFLYEIAFDRAGTKKMMATYAKLEKI